MKKFAVIGNPISHSFSPILHNIVYKKLNIKADYIKIEIVPENLFKFIQTNKFNGLNVTIPYKEKVLSMLTEIDKSSKIIGAVNCISGKKGFNTDWMGFLKSMEINNIKLEGKDCLILGAGGAARAIAYALYKANARSINFKNRTKKKLNYILRWINSFFKNNKINSNPDIIINCTSLGMYPQINESPFEINNINNNQILIDTIYNPMITNWLRKGEKKGLKTIGGLDMLIAQALYSINIWFGINTYENIDLTKLKEELKVHYVS